MKNKVKGIAENCCASCHNYVNTFNTSILNFQLGIVVRGGGEELQKSGVLYGDSGTQRESSSGSNPCIKAIDDHPLA